MGNFLTTRSHGWSSLAELRRDMEHLLDDFMTTTPETTSVRLEQEWNPACDIEETEDHYLMTFEMPGIPRDQIKIECVDNQVTVSGERKRETEKTEKGHTYSERQYGKFYRSFTLPMGVNADKVEAKFQDGVLRLTVPKAETAKPRQIPIKEDQGAA